VYVGLYTCLSIHIAAGSTDDDTVVYMEAGIVHTQIAMILYIPTLQVYMTTYTYMYVYICTYMCTVFFNALHI